VARKTSDIAMLLGSRGKARTSKSTGLTGKLVGFIDSMLGRSAKRGRRQEKREQTVPLLVFSLAVLLAFGGGYAVGGGFAKSDGTDPLRAAGREPLFVDEVNTTPLSSEAFIVAAYPGVAPAEAKARAQSLAKHLQGRGLTRTRPYPWPQQGPSLWVVAVYFDGPVQAEQTAAQLRALPDDVPDQMFASYRANDAEAWPSRQVMPKE
jgi:hypothetical protein